MRAVSEHLEPNPNLSWRHARRHASLFPFGWHFHPEIELTLITKGSGTRFVGDSIEDYGVGDLVLMGSELPHAYVSAPRRGGHEAIIVQFREDFLGASLFDRPEFSGVRTLLERSKRGLHFSASIRTSTLIDLDNMPPAQCTLGLLRTLVELAESNEWRPLASERHRPTVDRAAGDRINAILQLVHADYAREISLADVAEIAHMAPASVSRFFRRTTGATITGYLNIVRVNAACRLLMDTDLPITDIAGECGYKNLSHFNRRFRLLKDMAPREWRSRESRPATPPRHRRRQARSEERRVGKECGYQCRSRWSPYH